MSMWPLAAVITLLSWFLLIVLWWVAGVPEDGLDVVACVFCNVVLGFFVPFVAFRYLED